MASSLHSAAFKSKSIDIDGEMLRFEIWDTAGEERVCTYLHNFDYF